MYLSYNKWPDWKRLKQKHIAHAVILQFAVCNSTEAMHSMHSVVCISLRALQMLHGIAHNTVCSDAIVMKMCSSVLWIPFWRWKWTKPENGQTDQFRMRPTTSKITKPYNLMNFIIVCLSHKAYRIFRSFPYRNRTGWR